MTGTGPVPRQVTGTALWIAAARARESSRPDALFVDPWAAELAGPEGRERLAASEGPSGQENPFLPVRTRFFDDLLLAEDWAEQVVLLGAGMDTRAYRLDLRADAVVFEVDDPAVFAAKDVVLGAVAPRCERREVSADLAAEWRPALVDAGFSAARPTLWLAEGLLFYLTGAAVDRLLGTAAQACRARALFAADVFGTGLLRLPGMRPLVEHRQASGLALPFCTDEPDEVFAAQGWSTTLVRLGQAGASYGRLPTTPPDAARAPDPTMQTSFAVGRRDGRSCGY